MSNRAIKLASYEDILMLPDNVVGEIINGRLETHPHPHPAPKHALASSSLGGELFPRLKKAKGVPVGGGLLTNQSFICQLHLDSHVLVPDLVGWKKEKCRYCPIKPGE